MVDAFCQYAEAEAYDYQSVSKPTPDAMFNFVDSLVAFSFGTVH